MSLVRRRAVVSGRVQGVYFRVACREMAQRLGVSGWVRNRPDGTVEVVAEGTRHEVDALLAWCGHGPPHAEVRDIALHDEEPVGETTFRVVGR